MSSITRITNLPSEIPLLILDRVPLEDLIRSAPTSRLWHQWQQFICNKRTVLTIYHDVSDLGDRNKPIVVPDWNVGVPDYIQPRLAVPFCNEIEFDDFNHKSLQFQSGSAFSTIRFTKKYFTLMDAQWLTDTFPQIKTFFFSQNTSKAMNNQIALTSLIYLLQLWKCSLESVKLHLSDYAQIDVPNLLTAFWTQINRLSALKCLMIEFPNAECLPLGRLSIVDQLEQFFLFFGDIKMNILSDIFKQLELADPNQLRQYAVMQSNLQVFWKWDLNRIIQSRYRSNSNGQLVQLPGYLEVDNTEDPHIWVDEHSFATPQLNQFFRTLPNLTTLQIQFSQSSEFFQLMKPLESLQHLIFLGLICERFEHPQKQTSKPSWSTLCSVKVLAIHFAYLRCHQDLDLYLDYSFPEVQIVKFICRMGENRRENYLELYPSVPANVIIQLLKPLQKCLKLRKIYANPKMMEVMKDELDNLPNQNIKWQDVQHCNPYI